MNWMLSHFGMVQNCKLLFTHRITVYFHYVLTFFFALSLICFSLLHIYSTFTEMYTAKVWKSFCELLEKNRCQCSFLFSVDGWIMLVVVCVCAINLAIFHSRFFPSIWKYGRESSTEIKLALWASISNIRHI